MNILFVRGARYARWACALLCLSGLAAYAEADPAPFQTASVWIQAAHKAHFLPAAQSFSDRSRMLATAVKSLCLSPSTSNLGVARSAWTGALLSWANLHAVPVGPVVTLRSERMIDFWPTRPIMIEAAVRQQPRTVTDLERVGVAAKGLPAVEALLWSPSLAAHTDTQRCAYTELISEALAQHASDVNQNFITAATTQLSDEEAEAQLGEWINQTVVSLEALLAKQMRKPLLTGKTDAFPRSLSGNTAIAWQISMQSLNRFLLGRDQTDIHSLDAYLRGRGFLDLSAKLRAATAQAQSAVDAAAPDQPASLEAAIAALQPLKRLVQDNVASALKISLGFSDADGD